VRWMSRGTNIFFFAKRRNRKKGFFSRVVRFEHDAVCIPITVFSDTVDTDDESPQDKTTREDEETTQKP